MTDFELLRQLLFSDASIAAIDRIEAQAAADAELEVEVERLRATVHMYSKMGTPVEAWERVKRAEAEVERLQQLNAEFQAAWTRARQDMKAEVERLTAALEPFLQLNAVGWLKEVDAARAALAKEEV